MTAVLIAEVPVEYVEETAVEYGSVTIVHPQGQSIKVAHVT